MDGETSTTTEMTQNSSPLTTTENDPKKTGGKSNNGRSINIRRVVLEKKSDSKRKTNADIETSEQKSDGTSAVAHLARV